jgi:ribose 5-phosphate isomerase A
LSDSGNYVLDCAFGQIPEPEFLQEMLAMIPGVVESGLFIGIADLVVIGDVGGTAIVEAPDDED